MVLVETNFPRGGTVQKRPEPEAVDFGAKLVKRKKKKTKEENDSEKEKETKIEAISAELLTYKTIQEGMVLYGIVKYVDPIYLKISLPGRIVAKVYASEISDSYDKIIKEYIQATGNVVEGFKPLDQMYSVGESVYGKVTNIKENDLKTRVEVVLSLKPHEVHSNLFHEIVSKGLIFNGAIEEILDHGFVIESGIKNLRCFLPKDNIDENDLQHICIGKLVFLKIVKLTQFSNASTAVCKLLKNESERKVKDLNDPRLEYLMPSSIVKFTITKILKDGLQGTIMNGTFTAYVNEHQLQELFSMSDEYKVDSTINARILYIMPLSKLIYLSLRINSQNIQEDNLLKRGKIIEGSVNRHGTGGIIFQIQESEKAVLSYNSLKSHIVGNFDEDNLVTKYSKNSVHKLRIMDYDYVDNFYTCSDNPNILSEKYFTLDDCKAGDFVTVVVKEKDKNSGNLYFKLGNCNALMEKVFQSPQIILTATENTRIKCRILGVNYNRNVVYLTNRQEYMNEKTNILSNIKKANIGHAFLGTIVKCTERFLIVKFFNGIKGILYKTGIRGFMSSELDSFSVGQTMLFRILKKDGDKLLLALVDEIFRVGDTCQATVSNYLETGLEISVKNQSDHDVKGLIPVHLLTEFSELNTANLKTYIPGQPLEVACFFKNIFSLRDVEYFKENPIKTYSSLKPGDIIRGSIKTITDDIVEVLLPIRNYNKLLRIHLKMILSNMTFKPNVTVDPDQLIYVKVLSKDSYTKALTVSAKLTDVWNVDFNITANLFAKYLEQVKHIKKSLKSKGDPLAEFKFGEVVTARVTLKIKNSSDCYLELDNGVSGIIKPHLFCESYKDNNENKEYKEGDKMDVIILWIDYTNQFVYCSNQHSTIKKISPVFKLPENLVNKSSILAKVLLKFDNFVICSLKQNQNPIVFVPMRVHYNDFESSITTKVIEGDFCRINFIHKNYPIAIFEDTAKVWKQYKLQKRKQIEAEEIIKKKRQKLCEDSQNEVNKEQKEKVNKKITLEKKNQNELSKLEPSSDAEDIDFDEFMKNVSDDDIDFDEFMKHVSDEDIDKPEKDIKIDNFSNIKKDLQHKKKVGNNSPVTALLPGADNFWTTDLDKLVLNQTAKSSSEESEEEDELNEKKRKKRLTAAERSKAEKVEEARIREIENKFADSNFEPENVDEFERLILSDPNDSKNWIKYMAYYLQTTEIDKARTVAKRALKAISFREQQELRNVWVALLNLESNYGSKENFYDTLKEALLCNDPLNIYIRVIEILTTAKKVPELSDIISVATKKFKENAEIWKTAASAFFQVDMKEKGQQLLHRCLSTLPEREHVNTIAAFANINHKHGDKETAHTLMEQILTSYPKRVDVWSHYVDMLLKDSLVEAARRTLERAVIQKIPLKKMKTLFKKYLEFEEKYGDETTVLKVKELAQNYVEKET